MDVIYEQPSRVSLANSNVNLSLISYIMIAHNSIYQRVYKKVYVYTMIIFCWIFSYGFQLPTLFGVWGEYYILNYPFKKSLKLYHLWM